MSLLVKQVDGQLCALTARTVYPTRKDAFPAATFFDNAGEFEYIRHVQENYKGVFGICSCPAGSFSLHQRDVLAPTSSRTCHP